MKRVYIVFLLLLGIVACNETTEVNPVIKEYLSYIEKASTFTYHSDSLEVSCFLHEVNEFLDKNCDYKLTLADNRAITDTYINLSLKHPGISAIVSPNINNLKQAKGVTEILVKEVTRNRTINY